MVKEDGTLHEETSYADYGRNDRLWRFSPIDGEAGVWAKSVPDGGFAHRIESPNMSRLGGVWAKRQVRVHFAHKWRSRSMGEISA